MNFSTAPRVQQTIRAGDTVEWERGVNRVKINNAANCSPPLDPAMAKKLGIKINVNWGELMILMAHARRQYMSAFWSNLQFFKVTLPLAPSEYQSEWGAFISQEINKPLRESLSFFELHRSRWASVVCHGIGPMVSHGKYKWEPDYVSIEDLRIPTDTTLDFKTMNWYGVRHIYTPYELTEKAFSPSPLNKWHKKEVAGILKNYKEINYDYAPNHYDWETTPEKLAELVKQDGGYFASDAMPGIPLWHFYFQDNSDPNNSGWFMRVVPENGTVRGSPPEEFLYDDDTPVASKLSELLHCQFGDLCNKAPFNYHSIRSLGYALLEPTFYTNLTRCRLLQHIHDNFNIWLRTNDPIDKARASVQEFGNLGVLKPGVDIVPQTQRHQIEADLVEMGMGQLKQLQQEASSTYTQDTDTGTKREQTAYETGVKLQQVNALMGGLLMTAFIYEKHAYKEICRRFCLGGSEDFDVQQFQKRCKDAGIPRKWLDSNLWDIEPVTPLGMGNPTMAMSAAQQLMASAPQFDATAQQEIKHEYIIAVTNDARKAARWAPLGKARGITDSTRDAQAIFGTLMQGVMVAPREELSAAEQIQALLPLLAGVIVKYEQRDNMAKPDEAQGMGEVVQYINLLIQQLAKDPTQKQAVKQFGEQLGKLVNQIKGLVQRGQEAAQQQNGNGQMDAATHAKVQTTLAMAQAKLHGKALMDQAKLKQNSEKFVREQRRDDARTFAQIQRDNALAKSKNRLKSTSE